MNNPAPIELWISDVDSITNSFVGAFSTLNVDQLNLKPNPDTWSISQNIQHLVILNSSYFPLFAKLQDGSLNLPWIARLGWLNDQFGKMIHRSVLPENKKKTQTMSVWKPDQSMVSGNILKRFSKHQEELKSVIRSSADLIRERAVISSPANRYITYRVEKLFDILVAHEKRHFQQAKRILPYLP